MTTCRLTTTLFSLLVFLSVTHGLSQEADIVREKKVEPETELKYRRVYVPIERIDEFSDTVIPLKRDEFTRLISQLQTLSSESVEGAKIAHAAYSVNLVQKRFLRGDAELQVVHTADGIVMMPLGGCQLAIGKPSWKESEQSEPRDARIVATPDGKNVVLVDKSSTLHFPWTMQGEADSAGGWRFDLRLPACPSSRIELVLPRDKIPLVDHGIALLAESNDAGDAADGAKRKWIVELDGRARTTLRVVTEAELANIKPLVLLHEDSNYSLSPSAVSLSTELRLNVYDSPLRQLVVLSHPSLTLLSARVADVEIPWRSADHKVNGKSKFVLDLPEPILGANRVIYLDAIAPLTKGKMWKLPRFQLEGAVWQEGRASLLIARPLSLQDISTSECDVSKVGRLPAPSEGKSIQLQYFSAAAEVELFIDKMATRVSSVCGTAVKVDTAGLTASVKADLSSLEGERFTIEMDVPRPWVVESVEATLRQPDLPSENILLSWDEQNVKGQKRVLRIQLLKAVRPNRVVRLHISGYRRLPTVNEKLGIEQLRFGEFRNVANSRYLVSVDSEPPLQVQFSDTSEFVRLGPQELTEDEQQLVGDSPTAILFRADANVERLSAEINRGSAHYSAENAVTAMLSSKSLAESYRIRCVPSAVPVNRLLVHLSQVRNEPVDWLIDGHSERALTARRLSDDERSKKGFRVTDGELWEIALHPQRNAPFVLVGRRSSPVDGKVPLSLSWLPQAADQVGTLEVGSADAGPVSIDHRKLEPIPAPALPPDRFSKTRAVFRYNPAEATIVSVSRGDESAGQAGAWVWSNVVTSQFGQAGAVHRAVFHIENTGRPSVDVHLPGGVKLRQIQVDGKLIPFPETSDSSSAITVSLPDEIRFPTVQVMYTDDQTPPRLIGKLSAAPVDIDIPVLNRRLIAWFPPGYVTTTNYSTSQAYSWSRRLFGPLVGQPDNSQDPFRIPPSELAGSSNSPWTIGRAPSDDNVADSDWTVDEVEFTDVTSIDLDVYCPRRMQTIGWAAMMLTAGLVWWLAARSPLRLIVLGGIAGTTSLLVPTPIVPIATCIFLGILLATLLVFCRLPQPPQMTTSENGSTVTRNALAKATVVVLLVSAVSLIVITSALQAQEAQPKKDEGPPNANRKTKIYPVIIPVDKDRKPTGDHVFLPEAFYREIHRQAAAAKFAAKQWLLDDAVYQATLSRDSVGRNLSVDVLTAVFRIETLNKNTPVSLPFRRDEVIGQPNLDGNSIHWDEGPASKFAVKDPGFHNLEVRLRPKVDSLGKTAGVSLSIPRLMRSQLKLRAPADAKGVQVSTSLGIVEPGREPGLTVAQLGPTDRLAFRWARELSDEAMTDIKVKEMLWLHVGPGSVSFDAKFNFAVPAERTLDEIVLELDPSLNLRLRPGQPIQEPVSSIDGSSRTVRIKLDEPVANGEFTLAATFVPAGNTPGSVAKTTGVGHLRLPGIAARADSREQRLLAVSVSPAFQYKVTDSDQAVACDVKDFLKGWGGTDVDRANPQVAFTLPRTLTKWTLSTQPIAAETIGNQHLTISVGGNEADVRYECQLSTTHGSHYIHRLTVPDNLEVKSVSLAEDDLERQIRWLRPSNGTVTLLFDDRVDGEYRLLLRGRISMPRRGKHTLPQIHCTTATLDSTITDVYRRSDVQIKFGKLNEMRSEENAPLGKWREGWGRLVASLRTGATTAEDRSPSLTMTLSPNRPRVSSVQVTRVNRQQGAWTAEISCVLTVAGGELDEFRLDIPTSLTEPFEIEPAANFELIEAPQQDRRRLIIRPDAPVKDQYHIRLRGSLSGQPIEAPDVMPLDVAEVQRYLVVPTKVEKQEIRWEVSGLINDSLPDELGPGDVSTNEFESYRIVRPNFKAAIQQFRQSAGKPQVRLVDIHAACHSNNTCHGVATFDLEPADSTHCTLELPSGYKLVHVAVGGLPALLRETGENQWQLTLGPDQLPQRIVVIFTGQVPSASRGNQTIEPPKLLNIPVEKTLWTTYSRHSVTGVTTQVDIARHEAIRYKAITSLMKLAEAPVKERPSPETENWYRRWSRRSAAARAEIGDHESQLLDGIDFSQADLKSIDDEQVALADRLGTTRIKNEVAAEAGRSTEVANVWRISLPRHLTVTLATSQGPADPFKLRHDRLASSKFLGRPWSAILFATVCMLAYLMFTRGPLTEWLIEWPYAFGVVIGLAWWLWLSPSIIGIAIIGVSTLASLRNGWNAVSERV